MYTQRKIELCLIILHTITGLSCFISIFIYWFELFLSSPWKNPHQATHNSMNFRIFVFRFNLLQEKDRINNVDRSRMAEWISKKLNCKKKIIRPSNRNYNNIIFVTMIQWSPKSTNYRNLRLYSLSILINCLISMNFEETLWFTTRIK